jgi:hypothetical protein
MTITRRELVHRIGQAGGVGAAFVAMQGLGLFQADSAAAPLSLPRDAGKGTKIVILGAGMAGLVAAYELGKAGYECVILEARDRVGGRNWTVRRGTTIEMSDGTAQNCGFDEGLYFNSGPARLPSHHQAILGYCRELGVALEVEVNACRGAMVWNNVAAGQKPILMRQAINDMRGHVSELLAKAVNRGALDQELTPHDKERMVAFLKTYGDLSPDLFYQGSTRSGFSQTPGAGDQLGIANDPIDLGALLDADMWNGVLFEDIIDMQATMFQPVGGMDRIPAAFEKKLGPVVRRGCEVSEINRAGDGVEIVYREGKAGRTQAVAGDYCLCTIPLPVLSRIKADFSAPFRGNRRSDLWRHLVRERTDEPGLVSERAADERAGRHFGRILGRAGRRRGRGERARPRRAIRDDARGDRRASSRPGQGVAASDRDRLVESALYAGDRRALEAGTGRSLQNAGRTGRSVLPCRRTSEPCRRLAGGRHPVRPSRHRHDRPTQPGAARRAAIMEERQ